MLFRHSLVKTNTKHAVSIRFYGRITFIAEPLITRLQLRDELRVPYPFGDVLTWRGPRIGYYRTESQASHQEKTPLGTYIPYIM